MTNNYNNIEHVQSIQFENGKHIFNIYYVPGMYATTTWALWRKNCCYKALNHNIKDVVKRAEENGWVVFNYTDLSDSEIWYPELNPVSLLQDYHLTNMTTLEIALKYGISRDDVLMWLEKEANGELESLFIK